MAPSSFDAQLVETYAASIRAKRADPAHHPETSLYTPLELLLEGAAAAFSPGARVTAQSQTRQCGVPDFALLNSLGEPFAYVEAKAPEIRIESLKGQNLKQFERYRELPCVLYTNFHELVLFVEGERVASARLVELESLDPEVRRRPPLPDLQPASAIFERLFTFEPVPMSSPDQIARALARRARVVKSVVAEVAEASEGDPLGEIFREFEAVLFYELSRAQFAHAYAQTVAYGLLLARMTLPKGESRFDAATACRALEGDHRMLSSALRLLTQPEVTDLIGWSLDTLMATVRLIDTEVLERRGGEDAIVYFYEIFLGEYDPALRKQVGAYFTPIEVVEFQVRAADDLLASALAQPEGIGSPDVQLLDPAAGTATYPLGVMRRLIQKVTEDAGSAAVPGALASLAERLFAFELLVGPYAVGRWRLATLLDDKRVKARPHMILTDTLIPPTLGRLVETRFGFMGKALTEEGREADRIKQKQPIRVILGNPPYGRTNLRADDEPGSCDYRWKWIWGKVDDFKKGVPPEERVNLKNLANRYILFWRWAFWKLLDEEANGPGRGIVSYISDRSFLEGGWATGMRSYMREYFQQIYIVDIRGDLRSPQLAGAERDENVFAIQTPVAITLCVRTGKTGRCKVRYLRLKGTAAEKLASLRTLSLSDRRFQLMDAEGGASFVPRGDAQFLSWPTLAALFVEKFSGIQTKRDQLVIAARTGQIQVNLRRLSSLPPTEAAIAFHETPSRMLPSKEDLAFDLNRVQRFAYRPLDHRFLYFHDAFLDRPRRTLQDCWGTRNQAITTLARKHGSGPSVFAHGLIPDLHAYRGSFGGFVFPLWDDRKRQGRKRAHNLRPELIESLRAVYGEADPEVVFDYIYGLLQAPAYAHRFHEELQQSFPRVPFPVSTELFNRVARRGEVLLSLHTFETVPRRGENPSRLDGDEARIECVEYLEAEERVRLGEQASLTKVTPPMWAFEVSGYPVLRRWLEARRGLELSPEEIKELLAVTYAVRKSVEMAPHSDDLLSQVLAADLIDLAALATGTVELRDGGEE